MIAMQETTTSLLASFATLKGLSDEKKYRSPYQILQEFIRHIILAESLHSFSAVQMKNLLNQHFNFQIPEAVLKTALKSMRGIVLENGTYNISKTQIGGDSLFQEKKKEADDYSINIIKELSNYISKRKPDFYIDENLLLKDLISFLVEDMPSSSNIYTELISEYIIKNERDETIQNGLNKIREGSILYIGLSHNINEIGSIAKPLKLYLGTEILFSLIGYNGSIFQQFANDFFDQVRLANSGGQSKIYLYYFSEIKKEIDDFFTTASDIVDRKKHDWNNKPAMKAITNGCKTAADVTVRQADFFTKLRSCFGILEDPNESYYDEESFLCNLESAEYEEDDDCEDAKRKKEAGLKLISHINKLRKGNCFHFDLDAEHLIITNSKITLAISKKQADNLKDEKQWENICDFAVSLDKITSLLWYKLGAGFSQRNFPVSLSAILKARTVLSASVAKNAHQAFEEIKKQLEEGSISKDQVAARISALRKKPNLPEELQGDDIVEIMDFSPEYLSRYEEQYKNTQISLKEKEELIESIKNDSSQIISAREATIEQQKATIKEQNEKNAQLQKQLNEYQQKDEEKKRKKARRKKILIVIIKLLALIIFTSLIFYIDKKYTISKYLFPITLLVDIVGSGHELYNIFKKDLNEISKSNKN